MVQVWTVQLFLVLEQEVWLACAESSASIGLLLFYHREGEACPLLCAIAAAAPMGLLRTPLYVA